MIYHLVYVCPNCKKDTIICPNGLFQSYQCLKSLGGCGKKSKDAEMQKFNAKTRKYELFDPEKQNRLTVFGGGSL